MAVVDAPPARSRARRRDAAQYAVRGCIRTLPSLAPQSPIALPSPSPALAPCCTCALSACSHARTHQIRIIPSKPPCASHSQPARQCTCARKKPTHNSRSLTLLTSLPTGLDLALGKEVKNLNLLDLSVVGHPRFSVRLLVGLSAVTLPHYNSHHSTTSSTLLLPPFPPRCRTTASASR